MAEASHAVFLSYASQDAEAARKIAEALRAAGIEVFLDQSELRGGDVWDERIRREIHDCALFIPVISANTASRREGYFRLEWDLADQRSHMMARSRVFVVPVCLDATTEAAADVPESFRRAQWTPLPAGETPPAFVERVRRLLSPEAPAATRPPASAMSGAATTVGEPIRASQWAKPLLLAIVAVVAFAALAYVVDNKFWVSKHATPEAAPAPAAAAAFNPPPHSIAVLPFVNMSGDKEQEYFSEGLAEELLNSLSRINELQVAARTSSFSFQGEHPDIATVAHKLNVASVLEGSVRRSAHTVRITTQLVNGVTGFHIWSETYDRDLGDVLKLQTEIATAVASALKVTLLGNEAAKIEIGGTHNPAAFDAYLRGLRAERTDPDNTQAVIAAQTEAIHLDSRYGLAYAARSLAFTRQADYFAPTRASSRDAFDKALADAQTAVTVAPELSEAHVALAEVLQKGFFEFAHAREEYEHAVRLAPGNATALVRYGYFVAAMGDANTGVTAAQRAVALDRLNAASYEKLGDTLIIARRFADARAAYKQALALQPRLGLAVSGSGLTYYAVGDLQAAQSTCGLMPDFWNSQVCLSMTYAKLGQHADAEAMLARLRANGDDNLALQLAEIYAQWGDLPKAVEELGRALRVRDPGMHLVKTDFLLDPIRDDPRFQAIERELKFPN